MAVIELRSLTKDYGEGRGVFDVSFSIQRGECFGFLGPNGAGKTTTIRHIMGFLKPDSGSAKILGGECWGDSAKLMAHIGYLPGEVSLPEGMSVRGFLSYQRKMRAMKDLGSAEELLDRFKLDVSARIRDLSLGDRRKLAVVSAFMHDPEILILDEPTSGLDPIMQDLFVEFILDEKSRGKTILLSSHIFNEVSAVCDRIAVIKQGRIVEEFGSNALGRPEIASGPDASPQDLSYQGSMLSSILKSPLHPQHPAGRLSHAADDAISVRALTKDYGRHKGIFDLNFDVRQGEVLGLVGTNGSGKTTTIRHIMGFVRPDSGFVNVRGLDAWSNSAQLKSLIGYIPGEIQFPAFRSADAFFDHQAQLLGLHDERRRKRLIEMFRLDTSVNPRKMSKGMKQKTAIIAAFVADNPILVLDEPTTGLDPVMRDVFVQLIEEERGRGKTILMSTHMFEEVEEACDRVVVIHDGQLVDVLTAAELQRYKGREADAKRIALEARFKEIFGKEA